MANPVAAAMPTRKSVTGFVTKLVGDGATYGFINDEIFFQQTNVTDGPANSGDRVFAECEYSEHLPIKWNATSIKILGRASTGPVAGNILESDPRRQSRQGQMNQAPLAQPPQPQQPALPPHSVANTYQQHRQQRQSQHETSITQPPPSHLQQPPPPQQQPIGMLDQAGLQQPPEFFSPFAQPPPQDLPPFQHDTPMGPPKLEYTSQLGSAFVQNQFLPAPLLPQQPPPQPMLPQHQQTQVQQPQQQQQQHQRQQHQPNQRDQRGPRDNNVKGRFNDKNDRNQSNRGKNRNDQPRSNDRESSANARSSRSNNSREHSAGRGDNRPQKRDESSRQSPLSHSSRNNAGSEKNHKTNLRKHYEPHNVPKAAILTNLNGCNMRARCSSSVHVPSDLKNVIVNKFLRLDIKNTPKPLAFKIEPSDEPSKVSEGDDQKASATSAEDIKPTVGENEDAASQSSSDNKMSESKSDLQITPPSSRSEHKLNHKYGVKVVLISLPELDDIYKKLFVDHLDSYSNDSKSHPKLDEAIAFLCNKGPNGGHSLIGGKFDSNLDGFVEGENNEFENHGRLPDLVATCRRVVLEQTGLDLRPCQGWTLVSTFIYNNRSNYFSSKSSVEYSYIYLPHIWSMPNIDLEASMTDKESLKVNVSNLTQANMDSDVEVNNDSTLLEVDNTSTLDSTIENDTPIIQSEDVQTSSVTLDNISELKVADLKLELDKRDIKYKPNAKKAELALALQEGLTQPPTESADEKITEDDTMKEIEGAEVSGISAGDENNKSEIVGVETDDTYDQSAKRKSDDTEDLSGQETKKVCMDETMEISAAKKTERVELITKPFSVKARPGQQRLSTVTLYEAVQVSRYDQFELSVASHILKESLVQHLSEYIFTTLVEDSRQKAKEASDSTSNASSIANSQDTNNSDTNNNNNSTLNKLAPATGNQASSAIDRVNLVKEYPPDRYINLAFAYFDSTHMGYVLADDLFKLFNNTGLTISKRALWSLIGEGDKFNYRTLPDLSTRFPPNYVYRFPDQFNRLPGSSSSSSSNQLSDGSESQVISTSRMVEYQGVKYDVERLIQQVREAEISQVNTVQRFNDAILKHDQQEAEIHVLEVSQMSLSNSIKALNDEVSELKREKLEVEKRVDSLKKQIKEAIKTLSE